MKDGDKLDIRVTVKAEENSAVVRVSKHHTDIVYIAHNGEVMLNEQDDCECAQKLAANQAAAAEQRADRSRLSIEGIVEYAKTADLSSVSDLLNRQIEYNYNIAQAGVKENWGANVGSVLLDTYGEDVRTKARAYAAAGSDARMSGCELPVVINSGSGNQGIAATLPVVVFAEENHKTEEELIRALVLSHLTAIYIKQNLGRLSALCGCVVAATGSSCGITYLMGGEYKQVAYAVQNMIANLTGMICDGAKPSCALKLTSGVSTAVFSAILAMEGKCVTSVEGIIEDNVDFSIRNLTKIGSEGMNETDKLVLDIMTHKHCD